MLNDINFKKVILATVIASNVVVMSGCSSWWGHDNNQATTNTQYQNTHTSTDYKGER